MKNMRNLKLFIVAVSAATAMVFLAGHWATHAQKAQVETAGQKFKSIKVLNDMPADQMGKVMNMFSASLGVDCKFCHTSNDGDYEKEGVEHKETARKMIKMVFDLNKSQFNGRPEINCNTCHHGISHPQPSFPLGEAKPAAPRPSQPEKGPTADATVAKYEAAIGGRPNIDKATSRKIMSMRVEPDGKTTESETIWLKGGKYRADLAYGTYIVTELFDGIAGQKFGGGSPIELKPDEAEQIKREAEILSGISLKTVYPRMDFRSVERIDGKEVNYYIGTTAGNVRERLYFDVATGLLVRRSASTPTVFGGFVYQVDYSDYKDFGGVKLPTTMRYAVPHMSWTRKIGDVKSNIPVDESVFKLAK
jgi:Photosynthetic reaction centre cytochrome C subunit